MKLFRKIKQWVFSHPYLFLLLFGLLIRYIISIFYSYNYSFFNDSGSYVRLAERFYNLDLKGYYGGRTPGYSLFIFMASRNLYIVIIFQSILGILNSFILYSIFYKLKKNIVFSLILGLLPSLFLDFLFYERAILTEYLTLFLLLSTLWYLVKIDFFKKNSSLSQALIIGLLSLSVFLVRPMFLILPMHICLFYTLIFIRKVSFIVFAKRIVLILLPSIIFYYSWSSFNKHEHDYFSITTFSGINLAQNTTHFVDHADDRFSKIRDPFIRHRDSLMSMNKNPAMTIWRVYYELNSEKPISVAEFSKMLDPMNKELIKKNPFDYLKQVLRSWADFWKASIMWDTENFKSGTHYNLANTLWHYGIKPLTLLIRFLFLLFSLILFFRILKTRKIVFDPIFFCITFVLGASLGQALVTYGSNARFSMPFFPIMAIVVLYCLISLKKNNEFRNPTP